MWTVKQNPGELGVGRPRQPPHPAVGKRRAGRSVKLVVTEAKMTAAMTPITHPMPDDVFSALRRSPEEFGREVRPAAAVHWYSRGEISQEKAAEIAGLNRKEFLLALAREKVDVFLVDFDDLKRELELGWPS